ncbi:MAG: glutathione S-transferase [Henriciella sp.]
MTMLYLGNLNYSSWSIRAALVARGSGLEIDEMVMPIGPDETYDILLKETGQHRVPGLVADDLVIHDSLAIIEWIAEQVPAGKVWPADPKKRARARSICAEMHASFMSLRSFMGVDIRSTHPTPEMTDGLKWDIARVVEIWAECREKYAGDGDFLFGEWSAADAIYMPVATRFRTYGVELNSVSKAYCKAVLEHPLSRHLIAQAHDETWTIDPTKFQPKGAG